MWEPRLGLMNPARLVREEFVFGKRDLPIRFTKTETGGTCFPGCHANYAYDRVKAVPLPKTQTAAATAPSVPNLPRAQYAEAREVSWTATDIAGKQVTVPAKSDMATALILVSADEPNSPDYVQALRTALTTDKQPKAQYIVIVAGKQASNRAREIAAKANGWPVVSDPDDVASTALDVHGWPLAVVLDRTGLEMARLTGGGNLLATKMRAYLSMADGQINQQQLAAELNPGPLPKASPTTQAVRDLRVATMMVQQRKAEQAITYLNQTKSTSPTAQVVRAKALVQLGQPDEALRTVDRLQPGSVPAADVELVRAMAWVAAERWSLARPLLEQYVVQHPEVAEAHMLLGKIYERDGNLPGAVEQYKAAGQANNR
jgi:Flp pilus assembly protein TadD